MKRVEAPELLATDAAVCQECGQAISRHMRIDGKLQHPSQTASFRYDLLAPEFRPGGTRDPKWMEGVRRMLTDAKSVEPSIVESLFHYYDAAKARTPNPDAIARLVSALERIKNAQVAFDANPVGVIEVMREWAIEALAAWGKP